MDIRDWVIAILIVVIILRLTRSSPLANEEIVEWEDYRGNLMKVKVSRSLH